MTIETNIASVLAHSAVYFSREEWLPVADARNDGMNYTSSEQEETNEQAAGEASGTGSVSIVGGSGSRGTGQSGGVSANQIGAGVSGKGNTEITTVESSDPAVTEDALQTVGAVANDALTDNESVATASIEAGVYDTQLNDAFGEQALQSAADAEADSTTAIEAASTESQQTASNALAAAQNETLAGVTPAQEFQAVAPAVANSSSSTISSFATWIAIISGVIAIVYYLKNRK